MYCGCRLAKLDPDVAARTLQGSSGMYAIAAYPKTVGGAVVAVEDGLHMIGLCTYEGQAPPFKDDQLLGFMQKVGRGGGWVGAHIMCVCGGGAPPKERQVPLLE